MVRQSASKIQTLLGCSYQFYWQYKKHFPRIDTTAFSVGKTVHSLLECLVNPNRRAKRSDYIPLLAKDPDSVKSISRLTERYFKHYGLHSIGQAKVKVCLSVACKNDLLSQDAESVEVEKEFDIKTDRYWIYGFIDKTSFYKDHILLTDFKTSQNKPAKGTIPIQQLIYELALKHMYPDKVRKVEFQYLNFKRSCREPHESATEEELSGFEDYLEYLNGYMEKFSEKESKSNFAFHTNEKFMRCGKALGALKANGTEADCCPLKYPSVYFILKGDQNQFIKSSFNKGELEKQMKDGYCIERVEHKGCPVWVGRL